MMARIFLASLLLGVVLGASEPDIEDFDIKLHGYEFLFHDDFNLMLVTHGHECYTFSLPDESEINLLTDEQRRKVEDILIDLIDHHSGSQYIRQSSLAEMRNTYNDLLGDFHCMDKDIFAIDITKEEAERVIYGVPAAQDHTTPQPASTAQQGSTSKDVFDWLFGDGIGR